MVILRKLCYNEVNIFYRGDFMELGQKLKQAREEAGLSQRQLCGDKVTRNMLSQIEHGTARPSMETLRYFAARLGKPLSWFLEENAILSPNREIIAAGRQAIDRKDYNAAAKILEPYAGPDEVYDREYRLMAWLTDVGIAEQAIRESREPYALQRLRQAEELEALPPVNGLPELRRRRLLVQGQLRDAHPGQICQHLPELDGELLLRAAGALEEKDSARAAALLDACAGKSSSQWNFLRGRCYLLEQKYAPAEECLHLAENDFPRQVYPLLEQCCREQGDYRQAYYYACKQR